MGKKNQSTNAVEILHRRYIRDDAGRKASLQAERVNAEVAQMIYDLRQETGMTQKELADLVGTTQSVISRLEDADYNGHSLSMLSRIAKALNKHLTVHVTSEDEQRQTIQYVFREVMKGLRLRFGLSPDQIAQKTEIDKRDILSMERSINYRPTPLILHKLSKFYGISQRKLAALAGAIKEIPPEFQAEASRFAAKSESFSNLTDEEKVTLDEFVKFLKDERKKIA
ncbi:MAG: helix-turn-helix domain-containing protein [Deltaproteobacteria bacterium]|nr:helix-turn-helix domain-containing protein [Deltaproteobacteria bacterium]